VRTLIGIILCSTEVMKTCPHRYLFFIHYMRCNKCSNIVFDKNYTFCRYCDKFYHNKGLYQDSCKICKILKCCNTCHISYMKICKHCKGCHISKYFSICNVCGIEICCDCRSYYCCGDYCISCGKLNKKCKDCENL